MCLNNYADTIASTPDWLKKAHAHSKRPGLDKLSMRAINSIISTSRSKTKKPANRSSK